MHHRTVSSFVRPAGALLAGCLFASAFSSEMAAAQADGPFTSFGGEWRGAGTVVDDHGKVEPLRCRATNVVSDDNISLTQSLVCASDSYRVELQTTLFTDGHTIRGTWLDKSRNTSGNLSGEIANNSIVATITAPGVTARLSAKTSAHTQEVTIEPQGTQINKVVVTMTK